MYYKMLFLCSSLKTFNCNRKMKHTLTLIVKELFTGPVKFVGEKIGKESRNVIIISNMPYNLNNKSYFWSTSKLKFRINIFVLYAYEVLHHIDSNLLLYVDDAITFR